MQDAVVRLTFYGTREGGSGQEAFANVFVRENHRLNLVDQFIFVSHRYFNLIGENSEQTVFFGKSTQIPFEYGMFGVLGHLDIVLSFG